MNNQLKDLDYGIRQLEAILLDCSNDSVKEEIINEKKMLKDQISAILSERYKGALIRSKCEFLDNNENPNSNFSENGGIE